MMLDQIDQLQKALLDFSKRNRFLHIKPTSLYLFGDDHEEQKKLEKLYTKSRFYQTEYGLETALQVAVFIKWSPPSSNDINEKIFYTSPLFYKPCKIKRIRKIETTYRVEVNMEGYHVNPLLRHYFQQIYGLILPSHFDDLDEGVQLIREYFADKDKSDSPTFDQVKWFDEVKGWQLIVRQTVGLFNYKKSTLSSDYDHIRLAPNNTLSQLLVGDQNDALDEKHKKFQPVAFVDESQRNAIERSLKGNTVIQGPPGTGKSHTIVALMAAFLSQGKKILFVSEKKSALDVVANRLKRMDLGDLVAYFNTGKNQKKAFYAALKRTWENLYQSEFPTHVISNGSSGDEGPIFSIYPRKISDYRPSIQTDLADLINRLFMSGFQASALQLKGLVPDFLAWNDAKSFLLELESQLLPVFEEQSIGQLIFTALNPALFSEQNVIVTLEKRLLDLSSNLNEIGRIQKDYKLNGKIDDFTRLAITGSVLNMVDKVQIDLINSDAKKYTSFNTVAKKYDLLQTRLTQARKANDKWTSKPSMSEINELMDLITQSERQQQERSLFSRLKRNPAKLKTVFRDFHSGISDHTKLKLLEGLKLEFRLEGEFEELKVKLKHTYNINDPEREIDLIFKLRSKLNAVSENDYLSILEHPESQNLILELSKIHPEIVKFNAQCRYLFQLDEARSISEMEGFIKNLIDSLPQFNHWLIELKRYFNLPTALRHFLVQNPLSVNQLDAAVVYATFLDETRFEPNFNRLSGTYLTELCQQKREEDRAKQSKEIKKIKEEIARRYQDKEALLTKANFKLNSAEKSNKSAYKLAKRTVLHEINKQQRHLPIKSFFEQTGSLLTDIQPVWMMNPLTVSEFLPCEADIFDVVIFDESSQIPLEDGVPSIYRAKQMVVVGDSKQMPPSQFFSNREETITVLDQAEMSLESHLLRWHYRSKHPALIRFSNLEFYNGELLCLPPKNNASPFEYHFVEGCFENGENRIEAKAVAKYVSELLGKTSKKVLVIAFSQQQEKVIRYELSLLNADLHPLLMIRNLENAQGVEAATVVLSFGYGNDREGKFRLNFGPINQENGGNRLNVFFTRAIERMVVFTSIKSLDFGFSENRGVQLMKEFLMFVEQYDTYKFTERPTQSQAWVMALLNENNKKFNFYSVGQGLGVSAFVQPSSNRVLLIDPGLESQDVIDVSALYVSLASIFSSVKFMLTYDIWQNPERAKKDLLDFFVE